jgi:hypothetical protein
MKSSDQGQAGKRTKDPARAEVQASKRSPAPSPTRVSCVAATPYLLFSAVPSRRAAGLLLGIIYLGFVSLGLPDGTLGVAWPAIAGSLQLAIGLAGVIMLVITLLAGLSSSRGLGRGRWSSQVA